jgi:hypothetical protein
MYAKELKTNGLNKCHVYFINFDTGMPSIRENKAKLPTKDYYLI